MSYGNKNFRYRRQRQDGSGFVSAKWVGNNELSARVKPPAVRSTNNITNRAPVWFSERNRGSVCNSVQFQYDLPSTISSKITNWVYCEHTMPLFTDTCHSERSDLLVKKKIDLLLQNCCALTRGQLCADWFPLLKFSVRATVASKVLLPDHGIMNELGIPLIDPKTVTEE